MHFLSVRLRDEPAGGRFLVVDGQHDPVPVPICLACSSCFASIS